MDNLPRLHISVKGKGFSINAAYTKAHALTAAARRWKMIFSKNMQIYKPQCEAFIKAFDKTKHEIILTISYFQDNIYTKTKPHYVSHASGDLDNNLKLTIDGIFTELPTIDDALVTRITAEKIYSLSERIEILVETRPLCNSKHLEETVE